MHKLRGFHTLIHNRENLSALETAAVIHLAPMGVNAIVAEIDDCFTFQRYPELTNGDITPADVRRFVHSCAENGITVIPLYNCLGHQGWANSRNALLRAHPEFDETLRAGGSRDTPGIYCPSWCAADDAVYAYVFSAIDEIIDAFGCDTLHVGMDEVFEIGKCPQCAGLTRSHLFARTVNILHAYLASKGVQMMMWGDRYLDGAVLGHEFEADKLGIHTAVSQVPKDIMITDWHYERGSHPSVGMLLDHGFKFVWPTCWRDGEAATELLRDACDQAIARNAGSRMPGMLVTNWNVTPLRLLNALNGAGDISDEERSYVQTMKSVMNQLTAQPRSGTI